MKVYLAIILLMFIPFKVYADDGAEDAAKTLGWLSIGIGVIANVMFITYNRLRKILVTNIGNEMSRTLALAYKPMLNMHIMLNVIGYIAGMAHGLLLIRYLEPISLSLAIVMSVLIASGIMLRYSSSRNAKLFNRLLHGQALLTLMLIILILLHIATAED